jgi:hypothetical protein
MLVEKFTRGEKKTKSAGVKEKKEDVFAHRQMVSTFVSRLCTMVYCMLAIMDTAYWTPQVFAARRQAASSASRMKSKLVVEKS